MTSTRTRLALVLVLGVVPMACDESSHPVADASALTRQDLVGGSLVGDAQQILRFAQISDVHVLDDDGAVVIGLAAIDPTISKVQTAQRLQDEYTDEVLNSMIGTINTFHATQPVEFMISTGDNTDLGTVNEVRRFIDNIDGTFDAPTAFEPKCVASLPAGTPPLVSDQSCKRPTGGGVADTQTVDPDPNDITYQVTVLRTVRQLLDTQGAVSTGRNAAGETNVNRQTFDRAPGLPQSLRCIPGSQDCSHNGLDPSIPWYTAFGNHDGTARGTVPYQVGFQVAAATVGRHFMQLQHEFIDEFFNTTPLPGPVGHGFADVDSARRADPDERNDGYYAIDWPRTGTPRFRLIVLNTLIDGVEGGVDLGSLPVYGPVQIRNPSALDTGAIDAEQFAWLQGELAALDGTHRIAIIFSHHPDLSFAEFGQFGFAVPGHTTAAQLDAELASHPNVIAWVAGHTHRNRIRAFKVTNGVGTNGQVTAPVTCKGTSCPGFWEIETASLIDSPQEARIIEVFDNRDDTGVIRGTLIEHGFTKSKTLADADDRCQFYLDDTAAVQRRVTEADITEICIGGGTSKGDDVDRNVDLVFRMP